VLDLSRIPITADICERIITPSMAKTIQVSCFEGEEDAIEDIKRDYHSCLIVVVN